jgi:hypothetical protein
MHYGCRGWPLVNQVTVISAFRIETRTDKGLSRTEILIARFARKFSSRYTRLGLTAPVATASRFYIHDRDGRLRAADYTRPS